MITALEARNLTKCTEEMEAYLKKLNLLIKNAAGKGYKAVTCELPSHQLVKQVTKKLEELGYNAYPNYDQRDGNFLKVTW